ncbi:Carbon monoxide oxidation accessory protein CoxG [Serinicoccus hydrothermalis]|uniref:Carbon monoxide oxidation accessory protein CoxG n=1 Tax=Serinicoccus hydrothermalis TaxID=1758689 RepID=A0A1B1NEP2_9MICO|nr:SRPBCC family protein [Serinicoccus hydrothermalis]ANS79906.1 Carbon monoxide oxidation accessory protein CoxG [Serinicoccus hydrothermalis]
MSDAHEVSVGRRVEAPPAAVWEVVTDLEHAQERLSQVTDLHVLTLGPYAVGTGWRETRRMMGASDTQEMWVVDNDPERRTVTEARSGNTVFRTALTLEPEDDGAATQLSIRFSASTSDPNALQRLALRVVGPLGQKMTEKALRTELADIAAAAEALRS